MNRIVEVLLAFALTFCSTIEFAQEQDRTRVVLNPVHPNGELLTDKTLILEIPDNWFTDKETAAKIRAWVVARPKESKIEDDKRLLTINFEKKDPNIDTHADLTSYLNWNFDRARIRFPNLKVNKWQPARLDASKFNFVSKELVTEGGKAMPNHTLIIDSGDGYFTITLAAQNVEELNQPQYDDIFNSIQLIAPLSLPSPPDGFSWQKLEAIKAAVLMPAGWYFKKEPGKPAWFITRENIEKEGKYETGFTIQTFQSPNADAAGEFAKAMIDNYSKNSNKLIRSWNSKNGIFEVWGWESKVTSADKVTTIVHSLIVSNTKTNTFYYCSYDSTESKWEEAWKVGERMVQSLILNEDM